jgi:hypothetical protein
MANTFGGAATQTSNIFGDLKEEMGFLITDNPLFIGAIKALGDGFSQLIEVIKQNRENIIAFVNKGFIAVINLVPKFIRGFGSIAKAIQGVVQGYYSIRIAAKFVDEFLYGSLSRLVDGFKEFKSTFLIAIDAILESFESLANKGKNLPLIGEKFDGVSESIGGMRTAIAEVIDENEKGLGDNVFEDLKKSTIEAREELLDSGAEVDRFFGNVEKGFETVAEIADQTIKNIKEVKKAAADTADALNNPKAEKGIIDNITEMIGKAWAKAGGGVQVSAGIAKGILSGAKGAQDLVTSGIGAIGDAILPGIGGAVSEIAGLLAQGPDQTRAMIKEFAAALPDVVVNIVEGLAAAADTIVLALVDSLIDKGGLERIVVGLIKAAPKLAFALAESFIRAQKEAVVALFENIGKKFKIPTPEWVKRLVNALTIDRDKVKGKGLIREAIGFARGGEVARLASGGVTAYRGGSGVDTIPAMVSAGEITVDRTTTNKLKSFLDSPGDDVTQALLVKVIDLLSQPMQINTTAEVNGNALADIILELNRTNARLA